DLRLMTPEIARELSTIRLWKQIHFAWDDIRLKKVIKRGIDILIAEGVKAYKIMVYVLIGFNSTPDEDLYRILKLKKWGVDPFVMPYKKADFYQKRFARWVNHKAIFKTVAWQDYKKAI
ncbi:MAG: radical SAM protein, partial [Planctomycetes bacterium]|nr:radical SAM protein [Planctomycetota bacterium]